MSEHHYEISALRKIKRRFVPLLFLCFVVAFLDRVNIGLYGGGVAAAPTHRQPDAGAEASRMGLDSLLKLDRMEAIAQAAQRTAESLTWDRRAAKIEAFISERLDSQRAGSSVAQPVFRPE